MFAFINIYAMAFSLLAEAQILSWDDVKGWWLCVVVKLAEENELGPSSSTVERSCGRKVSHERNLKPVAEPHKIKHNYKKCMKSKLCAPVVYEIQDISVLGPVMIHTRPPSPSLRRQARKNEKNFIAGFLVGPNWVLQVRWDKSLKYLQMWSK